MELPQAFKERMKTLLQEDYESYEASFALPKYQGLRINPLKVSQKNWESFSPWSNLRQVPWCEEGFYYQSEDMPTKHPYYYAGLYYIQEPSAMAPAAYLPIEKGDKVLDLCAAPGGKSTQIAGKLNQTGLLVSNDISTSRAKALIKNLENCGAQNVIVMNETPEKLAKAWPGYFDKIIIDAPCSGEGMFKKDEEAIKNWQPDNYKKYLSIQDEILDQAALLLNKEGMILYSTCTFVPEENEGTISRFLKRHPDFCVEPLTPKGGISEGMVFSEDATPLKGALRLWPHRLAGEGHFVCLLKRFQTNLCDFGTKQTKQIAYQLLKNFKVAADFFKTTTFLPLDLPVIVHQDKLYLVSPLAPDTKGLRVMRSGLCLGTLRANRFEPHHALALAFPASSFKHVINLEGNDMAVKKYLKGETLTMEVPKGYVLVSVDGFPLGFGKGDKHLLKNCYPATWRMMR